MAVFENKGNLLAGTIEVFTKFLLKDNVLLSFMSFQSTFQLYNRKEAFGISF